MLLLAAARSADSAGMADQRRFPPPWHADKIPGGYVAAGASYYGASEPMSKRNDLNGARRNDRQRYTVFAAVLIILMFVAVALGGTSWVEAFGVALALAVISFAG
jgi:Flp pilus assembly protein TadB